MEEDNFTELLRLEQQIMYLDNIVNSLSLKKDTYKYQGILLLKFKLLNEILVLEDDFDLQKEYEKNILNNLIIICDNFSDNNLYLLNIFNNFLNKENISDIDFYHNIQNDSKKIQENINKKLKLMNINVKKNINLNNIFESLSKSEFVKNTNVFFEEKKSNLWQSIINFFQSFDDETSKKADVDMNKLLKII